MMSKTSSQMKVENNIFLGIDPGTSLIGYGVVQSTGDGFTSLAYGVINNTGQNKIASIKNSHTELQKIIKKFKPQRIGIERLFFANNQKTAMAVSEMRGVLLLAATSTGIPVQEFTPLQVKQLICNYGRADKKQVQRMVQMLLKISSPIKPDDAADALALAMCSATTNNPDSHLL